MSILLEIVFQLRLKMMLGMSLQSGLETVLTDYKGEYPRYLKIWLKKIVAGQKFSEIALAYPALVSSSARRTLLMVLEKGLIHGAPIDPHLHELQEEFLTIAENKFERKMQMLPLKLLVPLMVFILPAVLALIIGPLLLTLSGQL